MRCAALLALALLTLAPACKKAAIDTGPKAPVGISHPDLPCSEGTIGLGTPPPDGLEIYCALWFPDGKVVRMGPAIEWHSAARKKAQGSYADDKRTGPWQYWHPNGVIAEQGSFIAGNKEGPWVAFHENGERASEGEFIGGKEVGAWTFWSEDGLTRTEGKYDSYGLREGTWVDHSADDKPLRERKYRNGRLINQREYDQ
ncbi:MAG: hypothetical protein H6737_09585 [Alphaproteobacteria bacterium]|nr:hypothetical protein [Alphaproteobacteria bacterium]